MRRLRRSCSLTLSEFRPSTLLTLLVIFTLIDASSSRCVMKGVCHRYNPGTRNAVLAPCPVDDFIDFDSRPINLTSMQGKHTGWLLSQYCPSIVKEPKDEVCCTEYQVSKMFELLKVYTSQMESCPSCVDNFRKLWCHVLCSPKQKTFLKVIQTEQNDPEIVDDMEKRYGSEVYGGGEAYVTTVSLDVSSRFIYGIFDSCRFVKGSNGLVLDQMSDTSPADISSWLNFMGRKNITRGFPFSIAFHTHADSHPTALKLDYTPCHSPPYPLSSACPRSECIINPSDDLWDFGTLPLPHQDILFPFRSGISQFGWRVFLILIIAFVTFSFCIFLAKCIGYTDPDVTYLFPAYRTAAIKAIDVSTGPFWQHIRLYFGKYGSRFFFENTAEGWLALRFQRLCRWYAIRAIQNHRFLILGVVSTLGVLSLAFWGKKIMDPVEQWSMPHLRRQEQMFGQHFGPIRRVQQIAFYANKEVAWPSTEELNGTIFNYKTFFKMFQVMETLRKMKVNTTDGQIITFEDVCTRPRDQKGCMVISPMGWLQDDIENYRKNRVLYTQVKKRSNFFGIRIRVTVWEHLRDCILQHTNMSCHASFGGAIAPNEVLGVDYNTNNELPYPEELINKASAAFITIPLTGDLDKVMQWEQRFIKTMEGIQKELNRTRVMNNERDFTMTFMSERSLMDDVAKDVMRDIRIGRWLYGLIVLWTMFNLGQWRKAQTPIQSCFVYTKVRLGFVTAYTSFISCVSTVGFLSLFGIHGTDHAVIVMFIFVLCISVNRIFMTVRMFQEKNGSMGYGGMTSDVRAKVVLKSLERSLPPIVVGSSLVVLCFCIAILAPHLLGKPMITAIEIFLQLGIVALTLDFILYLLVVIPFFYSDSLRQLKGVTELCGNYQLRDATMNKLRGAYNFSLIEKRTPLDYVRSWLPRVLVQETYRSLVYVKMYFLLAISIAVANFAEYGFDQTTMYSKTGHLGQHLKSMEPYTRQGPPVYFVVNGSLDYYDNKIGNKFCTITGCNDDSIGNMLLYLTSNLVDREKRQISRQMRPLGGHPKIKSQGRTLLVNIKELEKTPIPEVKKVVDENQPFISYVEGSVHNWLDKYKQFTDDTSKCCRVWRLQPREYCSWTNFSSYNEYAEPSKECVFCRPYEEVQGWNGLDTKITRLDAHDRLYAMPWDVKELKIEDHHFRNLKFLMNEPISDKCLFGDLGTSYKAVSQEHFSTVNASQFMTHFKKIRIKEASDYFHSMKFAQNIAATMTEHLNMRGVEVYAYSPFFKFYDQFENISATVYVILFLTIVSFWSLTYLLLHIPYRLVFLAALVTVSAFYQMVAGMVLLGIQTNAISVTCLALCLGWFTECMMHVVNGFCNSIKVRRVHRAVDVMQRQCSMLFSGFFPVVIMVAVALHFSRTAILQVYLSQMLLLLVVVTFWNCVIVLPVLLVYYGPSGTRAVIYRNSVNVLEATKEEANSLRILDKDEQAKIKKDLQKLCELEAADEIEKETKQPGVDYEWQSENIRRNNMREIADRWAFDEGSKRFCRQTNLLALVDTHEHAHDFGNKPYPAITMFMKTVRKILKMKGSEEDQEQEENIARVRNRRWSREEFVLSRDGIELEPLRANMQVNEEDDPRNVQGTSASVMETAGEDRRDSEDWLNDQGISLSAMRRGARNVRNSPEIERPSERPRSSRWLIEHRQQQQRQWMQESLGTSGDLESAFKTTRLLAKEASRDPDAKRLQNLLELSKTHCERVKSGDSSSEFQRPSLATVAERELNIREQGGLRRFGHRVRECSSAGWKALTTWGRSEPEFRRPATPTDPDAPNPQAVDRAEFRRPRNRPANHQPSYVPSLPSPRSTPEKRCYCGNCPDSCNAGHLCDIRKRSIQREFEEYMPDRKRKSDMEKMIKRTKQEDLSPIVEVREPSDPLWPFSLPDSMEFIDATPPSLTPPTIPAQGVSFRETPLMELSPRENPLLGAPPRPPPQETPILSLQPPTPHQQGQGTPILSPLPLPPSQPLQETPILGATTPDTLSDFPYLSSSSAVRRTQSLEAMVSHAMTTTTSESEPTAPDETSSTPLTETMTSISSVPDVTPESYTTMSGPTPSEGGEEKEED